MAGEADELRDEVQHRLDAPCWTERARAVERLASVFCAGTLDEAERRSAEDAFRTLVYDSETLVRRVLAECLKRAAHLPRDIAAALASDTPDIAVPMLEHSPALADDDLLRILGLNPGPHRAAIARRQVVSEAVADTLCRCGDEDVVSALLRNGGAAVSERTLRWLICRRSDWTRVAESAARRLAAAAEIAAA